MLKHDFNVEVCFGAANVMEAAQRLGKLLHDMYDVFFILLEEIVLVPYKDQWHFWLSMIPELFYPVLDFSLRVLR